MTTNQEPDGWDIVSDFIDSTYANSDYAHGWGHAGRDIRASRDEFLLVTDDGCVTVGVYDEDSYWNGEPLHLFGFDYADAAAATGLIWALMEVPENGWRSNAAAVAARFSNYRLEV